MTLVDDLLDLYDSHIWDREKVKENQTEFESIKKQLEENQLLLKELSQRGLVFAFTDGTYKISPMGNNIDKLLENERIVKTINIKNIHISGDGHPDKWYLTVWGGTLEDMQILKQKLESILGE